jgi:hypothetical protein
MRFLSDARLLGGIFAILTLSACGNAVSDGFASMSQGVGSSEYQRELRAREAARRSDVPYSVPPEAGSVNVLPPAAPLGAPAPIAAQPMPVQPMASAAPLPAAVPEGVAPQTFTPIPFGSRPAGAEIPPQGNTEIVTVTSVPTGAATAGPNVMAYALQTRHNVGTVMHRRLNPLRWSRWEAACLQFVNQDAAQEAFLAAGGPERDRQNLDPDGDGFACWWDPRVYRQAVALGQ